MVTKRSYAHIEPDPLPVGLFCIPGVAMFDMDAMVTPAQAARAANVSRQLVKDWYDRKRLKRDEDGLVRLGDVLELEAETKHCDQPNAFPRKPQLIEV